jgi:multidrug transporter EmrE-like cation transporter
MLTSLAKAFPPAKVIFTGIGVLLGVRLSLYFFREPLQSNAEIF